jgi:hypothetical protein
MHILIATRDPADIASARKTWPDDLVTNHWTVWEMQAAQRWLMNEGQHTDNRFPEAPDLYIIKDVSVVHMDPVMALAVGVQRVILLERAEVGSSNMVRLNPFNAEMQLQQMIRPLPVAVIYEYADSVDWPALRHAITGYPDFNQYVSEITISEELIDDDNHEEAS